MSNSNRVLIFDVETTGLIPKSSQSYIPCLAEYPYILQLSFVIYNTFTNIIEDRLNCYIKPNPMVIIDQKITELLNRKKIASFPTVLAQMPGMDGKEMTIRFESKTTKTNLEKFVLSISTKN